jgi:hypothetical protein
VADFDQLIRLLAVKRRGVANGGDIGFLDLDDAGERTIRLGVGYPDLPKLIGELEAVAADVATARRKSGKDHGPQQTTSAKPTQSVGAHADEALGSVVLRLNHPNGTSTNVAIKPADIDKIIRLLGSERQKLSSTKPAN